MRSAFYLKISSSHKVQKFSYFHSRHLDRIEFLILISIMKDRLPKIPASQSQCFSRENPLPDLRSNYNNNEQMLFFDPRKNRYEKYFGIMTLITLPALKPASSIIRYLPASQVPTNLTRSIKSSCRTSGPRHVIGTV